MRGVNHRSRSFRLRLSAAFVLCSLGLLLAGLSFALPTLSRGPVTSAGRSTSVLPMLDPAPIKQTLTNNRATALSALPELHPLPGANPSSAAEMPPSIATNHNSNAGMLVKLSPPDPVAARTNAPKKAANRHRVAQRRSKDSGKFVRLSGEVSSALAKATKLPTKIPADTALTLNIVLNHTDQPGFETFLHDVYDPHSPAYRHFLTPIQISDCFGPSPESYDAILHYLQRKGFKLVEGSANRLTMTVRGTRAQVERTFGVQIGEYRIGNRTFYANDRDPVFPKQIASSIQAVLGLTD